jgi:cold shock CspA family protein/ribosome-associated translation inhibitor RaiA
MQVQPEIVVRGIADQGQVEARVLEETLRLERYYDRITASRVVVERSSHRRRQGDLYHVRVDLVLPGAEIVVRRDPPAGREHEDFHVALRDAFRAARRRIEDHVRVRRGAVKAHGRLEHGQVVRLVPQEDHGFLAAPDGHHVYFHRNSLRRGRFEDLQIGSAVRYVEEAGREGPQAARVLARRSRRPTPRP